jgi:hypothetical protein
MKSSRRRRNGTTGCRTSTCTVNLNRSDPSTVPGVLNPLKYATVLPTTQAINITRYEGLADYDSMQLVFERRFNTGLSLNSNYTLAFSNNTQGGQGLQGPNGVAISGPIALLPNDVRYGYGPADDVRHRVAFGRVEVFNLFDWPFFSLPLTTITQLQHNDGRLLTAAELATLRTTAVTPTDIVASPAGGVGTITTTQPGSAPRQVQFGFKLMF